MRAVPTRELSLVSRVGWPASVIDHQSRSTGLADAIALRNAGSAILEPRGAPAGDAAAQLEPDQQGHTIFFSGSTMRRNA